VPEFLKYFIMFSALEPEPDAKTTIFLGDMLFCEGKISLLTIIRCKNKGFR
jgi:hypothetical protein